MSPSWQVIRHALATIFLFCCFISIPVIILILAKHSKSHQMEANNDTIPNPAGVPHFGGV